MKRQANALALVEALVAVVFVAIVLAATIPNYQEAQVRTNLGRAKADMKMLTAAIEAYHIDLGVYPREYHTTRYPDPLINGQPVAGILGPWLSTPVAYVVDAMGRDPLTLHATGLAFDEERFTYQNLIINSQALGSLFWAEAVDFYGPWRLGSIGPDLMFSHGFTNSAQMLYDPTNGLVSMGNIWMSPQNEGVQPPVGVLLGAH